MDDADNHGIYDVNTVANYDPEIIPLLEAGIGAAFARDPETGKFVRVDQRRGQCSSLIDGLRVVVFARQTDGG